MHLFKLSTSYQVFVGAGYASNVERRLGHEVFPVDAYACALTTAVHSRIVDHVIPRSFLRRWYMQ